MVGKSVEIPESREHVGRFVIYCSQNWTDAKKGKRLLPIPFQQADRQFCNDPRCHKLGADPEEWTTSLALAFCWTHTDHDVGC